MISISPQKKHLISDPNITKVCLNKTVNFLLLRQKKFFFFIIVKKNIFKGENAADMKIMTLSNS